jgi:hypothetical protein
MDFFYNKFILAQGGKAETGEDAASYNLGKNYRNSVRRDADKVCSSGFFFGFSFYFLPVFRIHDILVWIQIRIPRSMPLTNGSRSGFGSDPAIFVIDFQGANKKLI